MKKEVNRAILSRDIVSTWIKSKMTQQYTIIVYPLHTLEFPERFVRELKDKGWAVSFTDGKMIITSTDPIALAKLMLKVRSKGYFVTE